MTLPAETQAQAPAAEGGRLSATDGRELSPATGPQPSAANGPQPIDWRVRLATSADVPAVAAGVRELLIELGGSPPPRPALIRATGALLEDPRAGAVLVAEAGEEIVGLLAASWQSAIHVPGLYGLIQDLWVARAWRGRSIGAELVAALRELAREQRIARIEVGLPRESFAGIGATEAFYLENGFAPLGPRMRLVVA